MDLIYKDKSKVENFMNEMASSDHGIWTVLDYNAAFIEVPELKELTTTPFMTQIVTEILPRLKLQRSGERGIKKPAGFGAWESLSDITWAFLNDKNDKPSSIAVLEAGQKVEVKLDDGSVPSASIEMLDGNGTYEVKFENGGGEGRSKGSHRGLHQSCPTFKPYKKRSMQERWRGGRRKSMRPPSGSQ